MVDPDGRLRRARAAVPHHRSMPHRRSRLARGGVQPLQDTGEPAARCHPSAAGHAHMEAGSLTEVPVVSERSLCAAGRMIKLTDARVITPYKWLHPDEER